MSTDDRDDWSTPAEGPAPERSKRLRDMTTMEILWAFFKNHTGKTTGITSLIIIALQVVFGIDTLLPEERLKASATTAVEERLEGAEAMLAKYAEDAAEREQKVIDALTRVQGLEKRLTGTMQRVDVAIAEAHEAADRVDKKVDTEVGHVRESITDKLAAVRTALVALRDVSLEKMKYLDKSARETDEKLSTYERRLQELDDAVDDIEKYLGIGFRVRTPRGENP